MDKNSKEFLELQAIWYKKLKDTGFHDQENLKGLLKSWSSEERLHHRRGGRTQEHFVLSNQSKETYFRLAGFFLHDHKFKNDVEKFIWADHAEGVSYRETVKRLAAKGIQKGRTAVLNTILRLRKQMYKKYESEDYDAS